MAAPPSTEFRGFPFASPAKPLGCATIARFQVFSLRSFGSLFQPLVPHRLSPQHTSGFAPNEIFCAINKTTALKLFIKQRHANSGKPNVRAFHRTRYPPSSCHSEPTIRTRRTCCPPLGHPTTALRQRPLRFTPRRPLQCMGERRKNVTLAKSSRHHCRRA